MNKSNLSVCLQARKMLHDAKLLMKDNIEMTPEMMANVYHAYKFCKLTASDEFWEELREAESTEHYKEHSYYKHKTNLNDIDKHIDRIIETGTTEHMNDLAKMLSEHFEMLKNTYPTTYNNMVEKLKTIK